MTAPGPGAASWMPAPAAPEKSATPSASRSRGWILTWSTSSPANMAGSAKASVRVSRAAPESAAPARLAIAQALHAARFSPAIQAGDSGRRPEATTNVSSVSCRPRSAFFHAGTPRSAGASAAESSRWRRLRKNSVTTIAEAELASDSMLVTTNWAEPAYSTAEISSTSAYDRPAARSTTPAAMPMPRYPSTTGTAARMPAANDSWFTALLLQFEEVGTDDKLLRARQVLSAREDTEEHPRGWPAGIAQGERVLGEAVGSSTALRGRHSSFQDLEIRGVPNHALVPECSVAPEGDPDRFRSAGGDGISALQPQPADLGQALPARSGCAAQPLAAAPHHLGLVPRPADADVVADSLIGAEMIFAQALVGQKARIAAIGDAAGIEDKEIETLPIACRRSLGNGAHVHLLHAQAWIVRGAGRRDGEHQAGKRGNAQARGIPWPRCPHPAAAR